MSAKKIRVALFGVGNCASSLVQGLAFYATGESEPGDVGLTHRTIGGYTVSDIEVVAAFDVSAGKVGKDLSEAIVARPNNAKPFCAVPKCGVLVSPGAALDGLASHVVEHYGLQIVEDPRRVAAILRQGGAEIGVNLIPVGSQRATEFYAEACIDAKVAFVNGIPQFIASDQKWSEKFRRAGVPCAGDDWKSQFGATILNEQVLELLRECGIAVSYSFQKNLGGNADFFNMTDEARVGSKLVSKKAPLVSIVPEALVEARPAAYEARLGDTKIAHFKIEGSGFGGMPVKLRMELTVEDSPNAAGVIVDAIRLMRVSLDRRLAGYQTWSARYFKSPQRRVSMADAHSLVAGLA